MRRSSAIVRRSGGRPGDMDQKTPQQLAGGVVPVRLALAAGATTSMSASAPARLDDIGIVGIERVEPVHRLAGGPGDAEGVDQEDVLADCTAGSGGDRVVLALEVQNEGGAGIGQQVGDHRADPLAGAGRGAGQDMAVVVKPADGHAIPAARRGRRRPPVPSELQMPAIGGLTRPTE